MCGYAKSQASPHLLTFINQCEVLERSWGPSKALRQLDMAVIVVLVDLEFCTKSECESVRFPRNFVTKILVDTNKKPIVRLNIYQLV